MWCIVPFHQARHAGYQPVADRQALTGDLDLNPPVKALFVYNCNPVTQAAEQDKIVAGLSREDLFTVVSEHFMTDTADYADVLPATTQVENLDLMFSWGHIRDLNMPAIAPHWEKPSRILNCSGLAGRMVLRTSASSSAMRKWPLRFWTGLHQFCRVLIWICSSGKGMPS